MKNWLRTFGTGQEQIAIWVDNHGDRSEIVLMGRTPEGVTVKVGIKTTDDIETCLGHIHRFTEDQIRGAIVECYPPTTDEGR